MILPNVYENCIVVPQGATFELQDRVFVYKYIDGAAKSAAIEVEKINDGKEYIVRSGLKVGDLIVGEGAAMLREGTPIAPKQAASATAQAPAAQTENAKEE